ncbi:MAG: YbaB/EbfC family nucleoid-associated protein [Oscillospiraceae bacterium]|nr:YbaB/EbfC family nucleoid-associated protein [Oscillospiraceae bacterium]
MKARLPQGYGGGGAQNMNAMILKAQKMQEQMKVKQDELNEREFKAASGGGAVEVTMSGKKEMTNIVISPDVVDPDDIEMLGDLIMAAVNEAIRTVDDATSAEMEKITGGLNLPGM